MSKYTTSLAAGFTLYMSRVGGKFDGMHKGVAEDVVREAKKLTPVDTGNLKSNWKIKKVKIMHWIVENRTRYAPFVEYGTPRMAPRGMLAKAIKRVKT